VGHGFQLRVAFRCLGSAYLPNRARLGFNRPTGPGAWLFACADRLAYNGAKAHDCASGRTGGVARGVTGGKASCLARGITGCFTSGS
jgi:hypothetical protein